MPMTYTKLFEPVALGLAAATIFTVPSGAASTLLRGAIVRITNTTAAPVSATLYSVPLAGSNGVTNNFFPGMSVGANSFIDVQVPQMKAGDFLQGFGGAVGLNIQAIAGAYYS